MGKKAKIGKARKDRFYKLAKETGYRSRAAFKLIQLNRKFEFLQKSRVVVDLCAAPGGWLQVAAENTPISSLCIGVDLVPIRPIPKTTCLQNDITTESCRQAIKKELQTWQADAVLNDGAPNVGKSWVHDAFQQAQLTLSALKLATGILRKGGWFVTKIFRSKDYNSLLWVFNQLFKKVHATKPQASRNESAEIFVVCEGYLAPDKLDGKFLDPKHVFKEVEEEVQMSINAFKPEQKQRNREGYPEGVTSLHFVKNVSDFISSDNYLQLLASCNQLKFDDEDIENNPLTTDEIKSCCQDIRVLGKKDIKRLINWRKHILKEREPEKPEVVEEVVESDEEDEELKLEEMLATAKEDERKTLKKRLKKIREKKLKLTHRMDLKMEHPDDQIEQVDDIALFDLEKINTKKDLDEVQKGDLSMMDVGDIIQDDDIYIPNQRLKKNVQKDTADYDYGIDSDNENPEDDDDISMAEVSDNDDGNDKNDVDIDQPAEEENPLLVPLDNKKTVSQRIDEWFKKDSFAGLVSKDATDDEDDDDSPSEDEEIHEVKVDKENVNGLSKKSKTTNGKQAGVNGKVYDSEDSDDDEEEEEEDSDEEEEEDDDEEEEEDSDEEFEDDNDLEKELVVAKKNKKRSAPELDAEGMALAARMVQSKKQKRDIFEAGYNRYMSDDTNLPHWFLKEEEMHYKKNVPVTKSEVLEYKEMMKAVDARPIKKVAEAKARKKMRSVKKLEKVRKKAETISDSVDTSEKEKWMKIKDVYKKAGLLSKKKKEVSYVVAKRGGGTRGSKPKGPFRVVDKRLKKDKRSMKANVKRKEKSKKRR